MLTLPQATALGPLEHTLMRIVWAHAASITVRQVYETLGVDAAERQHLAAAVRHGSQGV